MPRRKAGAHRPAGGPRGRKAGSPRGHHKPATPAGRNEKRKSYSLSNLQPPVGSRKKKVRVGRGMGSKLGKTAGAGNKGQKSRRGYSRRRGFEGGQMPLHRRMPKRGFHNPFSVSYSVVNLDELNVFPAGETVTPELLRAHGFIRRAKELGFTLSEIAELLDLRVRADATKAEVKQRAASKIADIERKIHDLQAMKESLVQLSKTCQGDGPAIGCPILEALNQPPDSKSSKLPKTQATISTRRAAKRNAASARS